MKFPDLTALQAAAVGVVAATLVVWLVVQPMLAGRLLALRMRNLEQDAAADPGLATADPAQVQLLQHLTGELRRRPRAGAAEVRRRLNRAGGALTLPGGQAMGPYRQRLVDALADHCDATVMPWGQAEELAGLKQAGFVPTWADSCRRAPSIPPQRYTPFVANQVKTTKDASRDNDEAALHHP